jgi:hypothetical protein
MAIINENKTEEGKPQRRTTARQRSKDHGGPDSTAFPSAFFTFVVKFLNHAV